MWEELEEQIPIFGEGKNQQTRKVELPLGICKLKLSRFPYMTHFDRPVTGISRLVLHHSQQTKNTDGEEGLRHLSVNFQPSPMSGKFRRNTNVDKFSFFLPI